MRHLEMTEVKKCVWRENIQLNNANIWDNKLQASKKLLKLISPDNAKYFPLPIWHFVSPSFSSVFLCHYINQWKLGTKSGEWKSLAWFAN